MPDGLTKVDVERLAALARLALSDGEITLYRRQLADILGYAREVAALDTTGVPPTTHVLAGHDAGRPDLVQPSLSQAEALANAPEPAPSAGLFKVPRVMG
ncbi:MAG: Asp-tRNA(Asn)/Glu-tRNA(Gln) amidotransferase subunit GatC [Acidobacteria bacterium]|nr:Asp-tRNA(Asn)/Glu-tRNA(Gln) amidotransferase subunit GatC [Acidobacteriota bacterium]